MTDAVPNDFNTQIIEEFRANDGVVGGDFTGAPMLLVTTTGARSGQSHVTPLVYQPVGDDYAIFASAGGAPTNPAWFHNVKANPRVTLEVGADTFEAEARILEGDERAPIWAKQKEIMPGFADYESTAGDREIPVVLLHRVA
jgi:deazaflavin-dependent oxidoreductase (nitroreductase family)